MNLDNIAWSNSRKRYRTQRGSGLQTHDHQSDAYPTEPPMPAKYVKDIHMLVDEVTEWHLFEASAGSLQD